MTSLVLLLRTHQSIVLDPSHVLQRLWAHEDEMIVVLGSQFPGEAAWCTCCAAQRLWRGGASTSVLAAFTGSEPGA